MGTWMESAHIREIQILRYEKPISGLGGAPHVRIDRPRQPFVRHRVAIVPKGGQHSGQPQR